MNDTRQAILNHLLHEKDGLTIDQLSEKLSISRSGVQQHLVHLERDGLIQEIAVRHAAGGGRPSRVFALTDDGYEQFPRHYAMVSSLVLKSLKESLGPDVLDDTFRTVAEELFRRVEYRVAGLAGEERLERVVEIMNELGYEATAHPKSQEISAVNCIYHHLAKEVREICHLDLQLLSKLTGKGIAHTRCMADGDRACVFRLVATADPDEDNAGTG